MRQVQGDRLGLWCNLFKEKGLRRKKRWLGTVVTLFRVSLLGFFPLYLFDMVWGFSRTKISRILQNEVLSACRSGFSLYLYTRIG